MYREENKIQKGIPVIDGFQFSLRDFNLSDKDYSKLAKLNFLRRGMVEEEYVMDITLYEINRDQFLKDMDKMLNYLTENNL